MAAKASVVIVKIGEDFPLGHLITHLAEEPSIVLASEHALALRDALPMISSRHDISVALLIGGEAQLRPAVEAIRQRRRHIHIVALAVESGTASLSLRDPVSSEIVSVIRALLDRDEEEPAGEARDDSGKILRFRAHPRPTPAEIPRLSGPSGRDRAAPQLLDTLEAASQWAHAATQVLISLWLGGREDDGDGPLDAIQKWVWRLSGIADTPAEAADRSFDGLREALDAAPADVPLVRIANLLGRDDLSFKLFLLALGPELDVRFHRLFGTLQDDLGRRQPSASLACTILSAATPRATPVEIRAAMAGLDRLRHFRLVEGIGATIARAEDPIRVDPYVLDWLLTGDEERLVAAPEVQTLLKPRPHAAIRLLPHTRRNEVSAAVRRAIARYGGSGEVAAVLLTGSEPGWLDAEAGALADIERRIVPPPADMPADALAAALRHILLAVHLSQARLIVDLTGPAQADTLWAAVEPLLIECVETPLVLSDDAAHVLAVTPNERLAVAILPPPHFRDRRKAIETALDDNADDPETLADELAGRFSLSLARLPDAVALAHSAAAEHRGAPGDDDWFAGFRAVAGARLPKLARRVEPHPCEGKGPYPCLNPVILPESQRKQLWAVLDHVKFGHKVLDEWGFGKLLDARGVTALFAGESGTGKTMAAFAIASQLGSDLYVVDLARIVSKYIGETEKNLDVVFREAEDGGAVLLFDEADALFGKRSAVKEANDRYANIEVAYLLQRMEQFDGLAILTTNHPENIDPAFTRRLRFGIDFPRPTVSARKRIWEQSIPAKHRDPELDFTSFARRLDITGGSIRQIALHAAMAAARDDSRIEERHLVEAARTELIRLGNYGDLVHFPSEAA
jgi:ATPase family protein associated with various cellular activities (AAA)/winged helix domain-containing protein